MHMRGERCISKAYYASPIDPETDEVLDPIENPLKAAFTWRDAAANGLGKVGNKQGKMGSSYDGSGFVFDMTNLTTEYLVDSFAYLYDNTWLDRQTRCIFISMVVYNINFNLYAVVEFMLEMCARPP